MMKGITYVELHWSHRSKVLNSVCQWFFVLSDHVKEILWWILNIDQRHWQVPVHWQVFPLEERLLLSSSSMSWQETEHWLQDLLEMELKEVQWQWEVQVPELELSLVLQSTLMLLLQLDLMMQKPALEQQMLQKKPHLSKQMRSDFDSFESSEKSVDWQRVFRDIFKTLPSFSLRNRDTSAS